MKNFLLSAAALALAPAALHAQSSLALEPLACAPGGFGLNGAFGATLHLTQGVRVTHLCKLLVVPGEQNLPVVSLWKLGATPTLLASAFPGSGSSLASICLSGSTSNAEMLGAPIEPRVLVPGDYQISDSGSEWYFQTGAFSTGPGVTFVTSTWGPGLGSPYTPSWAVFGPSFAYEPLADALATTPTVAIGGTLEVENWSQSGLLFQTWFSPFATSIPLPPFGTLLIGPGSLYPLIPTTPYPSALVAHTASFGVPSDPTLQGVALYFQSASIASLAPLSIALTNRATTTIQ